MELIAYVRLHDWYHLDDRKCLIKILVIKNSQEDFQLADLQIDRIEKRLLQLRASRV